jgi:hypothetical protein
VSRTFGAESGGGFAGLSEAELDLLADYAAGVLDGPAAAAVAHRLDADARWAQAHAALVEADAAVRNDLREAATPPVSMPTDVVARLESTLAALPHVPLASVAALPNVPLASVAALPNVPLASVAALPNVPLASVAKSARPRGVTATVTALGAARAKRRRIFTGIVAAAAAAVAIAGGIGISTAVTSRTDRSARPESAADRDSSAAGPAAAPSPRPRDAPALLTSGADYRPETLIQAAARSAGSTDEALGAAPPAAQPPDRSAPEVPQAVRDNTPQSLARLTGSAELAACLDAIRSAHPGAVRLVDFARFNGAPAAIVVVQAGTTAQAGTTVTVVAVGSDCGLGGADEKGAAVG